MLKYEGRKKIDNKKRIRVRVLLKIYIHVLSLKKKKEHVQIYIFERHVLSLLHSIRSCPRELLWVKSLSQMKFLNIVS